MFYEEVLGAKNIGWQNANKLYRCEVNIKSFLNV